MTRLPEKIFQVIQDTEENKQLELKKIKEGIEKLSNVLSQEKESFEKSKLTLSEQLLKDTLVPWENELDHVSKYLSGLGDLK